MSHVPKHRALIDKWINEDKIDFYTVSMESMRSWMVVNGTDKKQIKNLLMQSPLSEYWTIEIDELFVYDSKSFRLPEVSLN